VVSFLEPCHSPGLILGPRLEILPTGDGPNDDERFLAGRNSFWDRSIRRFLGKILLAGKETQEGPSQVCDVVADGPPEHRIRGFELVKDRALGDRTLDLEYELAADTRQISKMEWEYDSDHGPLPPSRKAKPTLSAIHASVWTSTESTAGRSRTIGAQLSPPSGDA